jgi:hypothetical protein
MLARASMALVLIAVLGASMLPAQTASQLFSCVAFNDDPTGIPVPIYCCNMTASTSFVAASAFIATELEVMGTSATPGLCGTLANATTGMSASTCVSTTLPAAQWRTMTFTPVAFAPGDTCVISLWPLVTTMAGMLGMTLHSNPAGTTPFTLNRTCFGTPCIFTPAPPCPVPPSIENLMFRLRGPACTGGSPGSTTTVGIPCGSPAPTLTSPIPVVGNGSFGLYIASGWPVGAPAYLFLAEGSATAGVPVESGHPCTLYLGLASLANLASLGYEPIASATVDSFGSATFPMPIPGLPVLIGARVTFQAAIVDPTGVPLSTVPGVAIKLTNAVQLQIGA